MGYYIKTPYQLHDPYEELASKFVSMFDADETEQIKSAVNGSVVEHLHDKTIIDLNQLKSDLSFDDSIKHIGEVIRELLQDDLDEEL